MNGMTLRPLSTGEVLDQAFQIYRSRFGLLFLVSIVCYAPWILAVAALSGGAESGGIALGSVYAAVGFISFLGMVACWAAVATVCDDAIQGTKTRPGTAIRAGVRFVPKIFLLVIVAWLLMIPPLLVGSVIAAVVLPKFGADNAGTVAVTAVALILIGVFFMVWWVPMTLMSIPAAVVEGTTAVGALFRANGLAKGARVRTTAIGFLTWLIVTLPTVGIMFLLSLLSGATLARPMTGALPQTAVGLVSTVTIPFMVSVMVVVYYERRVRREGYDVEMASAALTAESDAA